jgi:hypothetical protein
MFRANSSQNSTGHVEAVALPFELMVGNQIQNVEAETDGGIELLRRDRHRADRQENREY